MATTEEKLSGRVAFTYPDFVHFQSGRWFVVCALEMQTVAIGWQVYAITSQPLALGLVGLFQFLPGLLLFLITGHAADRFDRKKLIAWCYIGFAVCSSLLLAISLSDPKSVHAIYGVALLLGVVRSFYGPAGRSILPRLVSPEHFPNAVAWASTVFMSATILGPTVGGLVYAAAAGPSAGFALSPPSPLFWPIMIPRAKVYTKIISTEKPRVAPARPRPRYIRPEKAVLGGTFPG